MLHAYFFYFCLYVFIIVTINKLTFKFIFINPSIVSHILVHFFKSCLFFTMKDIVAFSSSFLAYPVICGSFMHNGLILSLSLYPIKYLREFFVPYGSFLETNMFLTSMSYLFVRIKAASFDFFVIKIYVLSTHSYMLYKKK